MSVCVALIVGAGRSRRFGGDLPKQYSPLGDSTVFARSLSIFAAHARISAVRAVIHDDDRDLYEAALAGRPAAKLLAPVGGGDSRRESVRLGLASLQAERPDMVLVHDAARPFVTAALIDRVIDALGRSKGAIAALPVHDTLKSGGDGFIAATVDRAGLWRAQTPQGFHFADILAAHENCALNPPAVEPTDDAAVAEQAGMAVELVRGDEGNIKITTMDDLERARRLAGGGEQRTGTGFDVHRFCPGDRLSLGGVVIPHDFALDGHSDADVALHALTDALLGAVGEGDIGSHFAPGDGRWKDAPSSLFLAHARDLIVGRGGRIVNVDVTVICQQPKIDPFREAMRTAVAGILEIDRDRVSIKATTTERLGFTGRNEGMAAQAVATVYLPVLA